MCRLDQSVSVQQMRSLVDDCPRPFPRRLPPQNQVSQHEGIVVHLVTGRIHESYRTLPCKGTQLIEESEVMVHLFDVAAAKLFPTRGIVPEPFYEVLHLALFASSTDRERLSSSRLREAT